MKRNRYFKILLILFLSSYLISCVKLKPEPLSFFAPENTFIDKAGIEAGLITCRKQIKWEWFGDAFNAGACETPLVYEYAFSDVSIILGQ